MAKKSKIAKNEQRIKLTRKYYAKRMELKTIINDPEVPQEEKDLAYSRIRKIPRNANPNRVMNRCRITGRTRAVYRKFGVSRITLREMANNGLLPGVTKSSW